MTTPPPYVRPAHAAKLCSVHISTFWRWVKLGTLTTTKIGGCTFVRFDDIRAIMGDDPAQE